MPELGRGAVELRETARALTRAVRATKGADREGERASGGGQDPHPLLRLGYRHGREGHRPAPQGMPGRREAAANKATAEVHGSSLGALTLHEEAKARGRLLVRLNQAAPAHRLDHHQVPRRGSKQNDHTRKGLSPRTSLCRPMVFRNPTPL